MGDRNGKSNTGFFTEVISTSGVWHLLTFWSVFLFAAKSMMPERAPSYAMLVSNQSTEEKAKRISCMFIFRDKPYGTTDSCEKK